MKTDSARNATLKIPVLNNADDRSDSELLEKLHTLGVDIESASFEKLCDEAVSVHELATPFLDSLNNDSIPRPDYRIRASWVLMCLGDLWKRWFPEKPCYEILKDYIQDGYELIAQGEIDAGLRLWLQRWPYALAVLDKSGLSIQELDEKYYCEDETGIENWTEDLRINLWNAGLEDPKFHTERILVCEELLKRMGTDHTNCSVKGARSDMAVSIFELGRTKEADALFEEWLQQDRQWGWGWISWGLCYRPFRLEIRQEQSRY